MNWSRSWSKFCDSNRIVPSPSRSASEPWCWVGWSVIARHAVDKVHCSSESIRPVQSRHGCLTEKSKSSLTNVAMFPFRPPMCSGVCGGDVR
ncbi:hypothetical protein Bca4012_005253 [Brassica carinata]